MKYLNEFLKAVFGNWVMDVVGAGLSAASYLLAPWAPAAVLAVALLLSSFRAFVVVATERDQNLRSESSQLEVAAVLAKGRAAAQAFRIGLSDVIILADYDGVFQPIEGWWRDLLDAVATLDPLMASKLGSYEDIDQARRPARSKQGLMYLVPLRTFLESRVDQISAALDSID
jgi:hypothetical protein